MTSHGRDGGCRPSRSFLSGLRRTKALRFHVFRGPSLNATQAAKGLITYPASNRSSSGSPVDCFRPASVISRVTVSSLGWFGS